MAKKTPTRSAAKKAAPAKKAAAKKPTKPTKSSAKPTTTKKAAVKKVPAKKAPAKKKASGKATKVLPVKKAPAKPSAAKKTPVKKAAAKKAPAKKAPAKKTTTKPTSAKTKTPVKKAASAPTGGTKSVSSVKKAPKAPKKKTALKDAPAKAETKSKTTSVSSSGKPKPTKKAALRSRVLGRSKGPKSIAFSLDEVKEIAKTTKSRGEEEATNKAQKSAEKKAAIEATIKATKPTHVAAASLADILGFSPGGGSKSSYDDPSKVPDKYRRYYKALLELREALTGQIDQHSEETLKRSSKDDAGDLSSYGQHMADAGTDTFDRDFALSLVANEQEALSEIEAAIQRIKQGTYGICEVTGKPIPKDRLLAVPFTRYSAEAQKQIERNRHRVRTQAGLFGEMGEDGPTLSDTSEDD